MIETGTERTSALEEIAKRIEKVQMDLAETATTFRAIRERLFGAAVANELQKATEQERDPSMVALLRRGLSSLETRAGELSRLALELDKL